MKLPHLPKVKNALHGVQAFTIFLAWCVTIAVFTKSGKTDGRTKYYFALVSPTTVAETNRN